MHLSDALIRSNLKGKHIIQWLLRRGLKSPARQEAMACISLFLLLAILRLLHHPPRNLAIRIKFHAKPPIGCARPDPSLDLLKEEYESPRRYFPGLARFTRCGDSSRAKKGRVSALFALLCFSDTLAHFNLKRKHITWSLLRFWKIQVACVSVVLLLAILWLFPAPNVAITIEAKARNSMRKARIRSGFRGY